MTGSSEGRGALRRMSQKLFPDDSRSRESRKNAQACKLLGAIGLGARVQVGLSPPGLGGHVPVSLSKFLLSSSYWIPSVLGTVLKATQVPAFSQACHPKANGEENARKNEDSPYRLAFSGYRPYFNIDRGFCQFWACVCVCVCVHTTVEVGYQVRRHSFLGSPLSRFLRQGFSLPSTSPVRLVWLATEP